MHLILIAGDDLINDGGQRERFPRRHRLTTIQDNDFQDVLNELVQTLHLFVQHMEVMPGFFRRRPPLQQARVELEVGHRRAQRVRHIGDKLTPDAVQVFQVSDVPVARDITEQLVRVTHRGNGQRRVVSAAVLAAVDDFSLPRPALGQDRHYGLTDSFGLSAHPHPVGMQPQHILGRIARQGGKGRVDVLNLHPLVGHENGIAHAVQDRVQSRILRLEFHGPFPHALLQLVSAVERFMIQPGILDGDGSLSGKGQRQPAVRLGVESRLPFVQNDHPGHLSTHQHGRA